LSLKIFISFTIEVSLEVERLRVNPARTALDVKRISQCDLFLQWLLVFSIIDNNNKFSNPNFIQLSKFRINNFDIQCLTNLVFMKLEIDVESNT
jgi:hypothetical protein